MTIAAQLERILEEIKRLRRDDLRTVERTVRELLTPSFQDVEREAALRVLRESGLVEEIKRPSMAVGSDRPPASIQGKPLSKTIIEERR